MPKGASSFERKKKGRRVRARRAALVVVPLGGRLSAGAADQHDDGGGGRTDTHRDTRQTRRQEPTTRKKKETAGHPTVFPLAEFIFIWKKKNEIKEEGDARPLAPSTDTARCAPPHPRHGLSPTAFFLVFVFPLFFEPKKGAVARGPANVWFGNQKKKRREKTIVLGHGPAKMSCKRKTGKMGREKRRGRKRERENAAGWAKSREKRGRA